MTSTEPTSPERVHVLIAEDSPTQSQRLQYILEHCGYQVTAAVNGREALAMARAHKPTLVISDVLMPEMNGYQLCQQIKSDAQLRSLPVILVTTLSDPQDVIHGLECRADNFIIKPYDEKHLLSRIQFVLLNRELHEDNCISPGIDINFNGKRHFITANRLQILNLLLSTYETAVQRNQELSRIKEELHAVNSSLEATNKELEAFSYSVSHDLRTPLRAIDGFSRIVIEEYASKLDENGRGLLMRVDSACKRMGQLIDDLLNLSRVSHGEMNRERVDLSALAGSIGAELQKNHQDRNVAFRVAEGLFVDCDARLLRVALENLLGNAWKFTSKQPSATIEFGMTQQNDEQVFFVRDDGAGFDMTYAAKLFSAFQRLHSASEFPGTGIGLATVQRVIHRHRGRVWAEGTPGAGAAFYFTL